MNYENKTYAVALSRAKYIGPISAKLLLERMGSAEAIFTERERLLSNFPKLQKKILDELRRSELIDEAKSIVAWAEKQNVQLRFIDDEDYPHRLKQCPDAPILIYTKGLFDQWNQPFALSVVGTRNISHYGQQCTERILGDLAELFPSALITSGLAYGVDITAHRQALAKGLPTLSVLAHGLDRIYPAVHQRTAQEILEHGAWISEYPPNTKPERYNFIARNRIIAGLSDATLVVEAGAKSGSLSTANLAVDYDREVLAIPGRVGDRYSEGCNHLIASMKASLVSSADDIVRLMGWERQDGCFMQSLQFAEEEPLDDPILRLIKEKQPIHINDLARQLGEDMLALSNKLFDLELDGVIKALPGAVYVLS